MKILRLTISIALIAASLGAALIASAGGVKQLTFGGYNRERMTCELDELGFLSDPNAKKYVGHIHGKGGGGRAALCDVSIPREEFDRRYQYCALASIETIQPSGYICEVFHFKDSVQFSYAHSGPPYELPMCSFVCPSH